MPLLLKKHALKEVLFHEPIHFFFLGERREGEEDDSLIFKAVIRFFEESFDGLIAVLSPVKRRVGVFSVRWQVWGVEDDGVKCAFLILAFREF